ncbi:hypothetical protein [Campylobacter devanensis]|nr:hypothetical protein [Campylobacter sp. P157]
MQTYEQERDKKVRMYADFIIKFCTDEELSDSDDFAIPLKDKEYANEAIRIASKELGCAYITLNPTILDNIETEKLYMEIYGLKIREKLRFLYTALMKLWIC